MGLLKGEPVVLEEAEWDFSQAAQNQSCSVLLLLTLEQDTQTFVEDTK